MKILAAWPATHEFACHSAACAPPSAGGTGGSKPGGSKSAYTGPKDVKMMGKTGLQLKALIKKGGAVGKDAQHEVNERTRSGVRGPDYSTSIKSHAGGNNRGTARIGTSESEFKARKAAEAVLARARKAGYGSIIPSMKDGPNSTNFL